MYCIRIAQKHEADILTDIATKSEAFWGYDSDYMERFNEVYKVTKDFISKNPTFVIYEDEGIIGFYAISISEEKNELEYFYITPEKIGMGYGKTMWEHMSDYCKSNGLKEIIMITSPQAREFYERMGAIHIAEVESLLRKGRMIPKLKYKF